jgi:hypothetical protein
MTTNALPLAANAERLTDALRECGVVPNNLGRIMLAATSFSRFAACACPIDSVGQMRNVGLIDHVALIAAPPYFEGRKRCQTSTPAIAFVYAPVAR